MSTLKDEIEAAVKKAKALGLTNGVEIAYYVSYHLIFVCDIEVTCGEIQRAMVERFGEPIIKKTL